MAAAAVVVAVVAAEAMAGRSPARSSRLVAAVAAGRKLAECRVAQESVESALVLDDKTLWLQRKCRAIECRLTASRIFDS